MTHDIDRAGYDIGFDAEAIIARGKTEFSAVYRPGFVGGFRPGFFRAAPVSIRL